MVASVLLALSVWAVPETSSGQEFTSETLTQTEIDSLLEVQKNRMFPLYGDRVIEMGVEPPYPFGVQATFFWQRQDIVINSLWVGFGDQPQQPFDFVKFENTDASIFVPGLRLDLWVLPFWDVYVSGNIVRSNTIVTLSQPISFKTEVDNDGWAGAVGTVLAGGYRSIFGALQFSYGWSDLELNDELIGAGIFSARFGTVLYTPRRDYRLSAWVGTMGQFVEANISGSVSASDVLPEDGDPLNDYQNSEWYQDLNPAQQTIVDGVITEMMNRGPGKITYTIDQNLKNPWNFLLGAELEINKRWQIQVELGVIGRQQFLTALQYRFNL